MIVNKKTTQQSQIDEVVSCYSSPSGLHSYCKVGFNMTKCVTNLNAKTNSLIFHKIRKKELKHDRQQKSTRVDLNYRVKLPN